jgi:hypothetical protein
MTWYSVVLAPANLKRTVCVALIVGTAFVSTNQLAVILAGHAGALVWVKVALTYVTPLIVGNVGVLSATRRGAARTTAQS